MKIEFTDLNEYFEFIQTIVAGEQSPKIELQLDYTKKINELQNENRKLKHQLQEKKEVKKPIKKIRSYPQSIERYTPQITRIDEDGTLYTVRGKAKYTIYTLLKIRKYLPQKDKNWSDIGRLCDTDPNTVSRLAHGIEDKRYEHIFKKWEEIQNQIPKPNKFIENNPEKRKALMGMG